MEFLWEAGFFYLIWTVRHSIKSLTWAIPKPIQLLTSWILRSKLLEDRLWDDPRGLHEKSLWEKPDSLSDMNEHISSSLFKSVNNWRNYTRNTPPNTPQSTAPMFSCILTWTFRSELSPMDLDLFYLLFVGLGMENSLHIWAWSPWCLRLWVLGHRAGHHRIGLLEPGNSIPGHLRCLIWWHWPGHRVTWGWRRTLIQSNDPINSSYIFSTVW